MTGQDRWPPAMVVMAHAMSERPQLQDAIVDCARAHGWMVFGILDTNPPAKRLSEGWPDLVLLRVGEHLFDSRLLFVELKKHGKNPTPEQMGWLTPLKRLADLIAKVIQFRPLDAFVWRPLDWLDGTVEITLERR